MIDAASDARKNSPSPTPMTIGLLWRAATISVAVALLDDGDGIGADHLPEGLPHGFEQRAAAGRADVFDQVHQHLGVGAAAERVAVLFERVLQHPVVLDDAVVYQGDVLRFGVVGMGVGVVRNAVRRPARVGDADIAAEVLSLEEMLQVGDLALAFEYVETHRPGRPARRPRCRIRGIRGGASPFIRIGQASRRPTYPTIPHMLFSEFLSGQK